MQSFQGNFQQTTIVESEARRASASGSIAYQRPGKMRWEYQEPDPQLLVTDGDTLWLYDPLLENVTIQELAAVTDGTALAFLLGAGELSEDFTQRRMQKSLLDSDKSWEVLELVPNREQSAIEFLQLGVNSETGALEALLFKDNSGSVRIIEFEALSYNVKFSDEVISQIAQLLQVAMLTGTDIVDNLRTLRMVVDDGTLVSDPDFSEAFQENIQRMLANAAEMQAGQNTEEV